MPSKKQTIQYLYEMALQEAENSPMQMHIGAAMLLTNGVLIKGYNQRRTCLSGCVRKSEHAEMACRRKATNKGLKAFIPGSIMVVVSLRAEGVGGAKPCNICTPVLEKMKVIVYYT